MKMNIYASPALLFACYIAGDAFAGDYNYEVTLDYARGSSDSINISTMNGVPDPSLGTTFISSDSDDFGLTGTCITPVFRMQADPNRERRSSAVRPA